MLLYRINRDLPITCECLCWNCLTMNLRKTNSRQKVDNNLHPSLKLGDHAVHYLGLIIDSSLTWHDLR